MKSSAMILTILEHSMKTREIEVGNQIIRVKCDISHCIVKKMALWSKRSHFSTVIALETSFIVRR